MKHLQKGFTLIELMIVVAIIGILAAIAVPQYQNFINKSEFTDMISRAHPYKLGVEMCVQEVGSANIASCVAPYDGRLGDIPAPVAGAADDLDTITVGASVDGEIIVTSDAGTFGQAGASTFILTPAAAGTNSVTWTVSGSCVAADLCDQ